jgi:hypothetical protein
LGRKRTTSRPRAISDESLEDVHYRVEKESRTSFKGHHAWGGGQGHNADDPGASEEAGGDAFYHIAFDNRPFRPFHVAAQGYHITADESR